MRPKFIIRLSVYNQYGSEKWEMATDTEEFPAFSERLVEDIVNPSPVPFGVSMDDLVTILKKREFRRELLVMAARKLSERLADHIEDSEGWHGSGRRDRIRELGKKP